MTGAASPFASYLALWNLDPDGAPIETPSSLLLPVRRAGQPAMLKCLKPGSDEKDGIAALRHFGGAGAVALIEATGEAVLMERAIGPRSLTAMALGGGDEEAARILASVAATLHRSGAAAARNDVGPLRARFRALFEYRARYPVLDRAADVATRLLDAPRRVTLLHADLHHENVLDSPRGWLAIDPKGAIGEPTYDVANLFLNPAGVERLVLDPDRPRRLARLFAVELGFDPERTLAFAFAHAGLATAWNLEDGIDPALGLALTTILETAG